MLDYLREEAAARTLTDDNIRLTVETHATRGTDLSPMEYVAYLAAEEHSDRPLSCCRSHAVFAREVFAALGEQSRQGAKPHLAHLLNTRGKDTAERALREEWHAKERLVSTAWRIARPALKTMGHDALSTFVEQWSTRSLDSAERWFTYRDMLATALDVVVSTNETHTDEWDYAHESLLQLHQAVDHIVHGEWVGAALFAARVEVADYRRRCASYVGQPKWKPTDEELLALIAPPPSLRHPRVSVSHMRPLVASGTVVR